METREEFDSIGGLQVPAEAYYGVQSLRGKQNFPITGRPMDPTLIAGLGYIKKAAAIANRRSGLLEARKADAIIRASEEVVAGRFDDSFIVDAIQGGAGTSANMNANEVIANRAIELLGGKKGDYSIVHPNDDVNMCQSTNDVYPTAGKLAVLFLLPKLTEQLERLHAALEQKAVEFDDVIKMGRTQLQDAVPIRMGQSFHAYASAVGRSIALMKAANEDMHALNMGGTAIGTGINASGDYLEHIVADIREATGLPVTQAPDLIDATQNLDCFVDVSGILKTCAMTLSKMSNDFRLLSSGPRTGMFEINLPARQNGSSIMPGKVNPVIPEVVSQVAFNVIGNDVTITMAAEGGQLELNAFEPVLFYNLLESIRTMTGAVKTLVDNCVTGITANRKRCRDLLESSVGMVTALCPYVGYKKAAELAKESLKTGEPIRHLIVKKGLMAQEEVNRILDPILLTKTAIERHTEQ